MSRFVSSRGPDCELVPFRELPPLSCFVSPRGWQRILMLSDIPYLLRSSHKRSGLRTIALDRRMPLLGTHGCLRSAASGNVFSKRTPGFGLHSATPAKCLSSSPMRQFAKFFISGSNRNTRARLETAHGRFAWIHLRQILGDIRQLVNHSGFRHRTACFSLRLGSQFPFPWFCIILVHEEASSLRYFLPSLTDAHAQRRRKFTGETPPTFDDVTENGQLKIHEDYEIGANEARAEYRQCCYQPVVKYDSCYSCDVFHWRHHMFDSSGI